MSRPGIDLRSESYISIHTLCNEHSLALNELEVLLEESRRSFGEPLLKILHEGDEWA